MFNIKSYFPQKLYRTVISAAVLLFWAGITFSMIQDGVYTDNIYLLFAASGLLTAVFSLFKYREMDSPQGITWRRILLAGSILNLVTAAAVYTTMFHEQLYIATTVFWLAAPGYGFKIIADFTDHDTGFYTVLTHLSSFLVMFILLGVLTENLGIQAVSAVLAGLGQTAAVYSYTGR